MFQYEKVTILMAFLLWTRFNSANVGMSSLSIFKCVVGQS